MIYPTGNHGESSPRDDLWGLQVVVTRMSLWSAFSSLVLMISGVGRTDWSYRDSIA